MVRVISLHSAATTLTTTLVLVLGELMIMKEGILF